MDDDSCRVFLCKARKDQASLELVKLEFTLFNIRNLGYSIILLTFHDHNFEWMIIIRFSYLKIGDFYLLNDKLFNLINFVVHFEIILELFICLHLHHNLIDILHPWLGFSILNAIDC